MADDGQVSTPEPTGRPMRGLRQSVGDMIRSMIVVLAVVGAILLVTWRPQPDAVREVSLEPIVTLAANQADFPILVIDGDERPTSVRWEATPASEGVPVWHVGYVTPDEEYVQVSQSSVDSQAYVDEQSAEGVVVDDPTGLPTEVRELMMEGWLPLLGEDAEPRRSLLRTSDGSTTVVSGSGSWSDLADAVSRLVSR